MATSDVRDILDVQQSGSRPSKKAKVKVARPEHISKEVYGLLGERAPPVSLIQPPKYQKRPKFTRKVQPWEWQAFSNTNRTDGLILNHWRQKANVRPVTPAGPATPTEGKEEVVEDDNPVRARNSPFHWAKYDVKVSVPTYTEDEYNTNLASDEWTKDETDYLLGLVQNFDLRWVVIADRYEYTPNASETHGESTPVITTGKSRSIEDLKARYYDVASKIMAILQPLSTMSESEYKVFDQMNNFDAKKERTRKQIAEALLRRTSEEAKEEELLLLELKRIVANEDRFLADRKELYERLETPPSRGSIAMYESSAGLVQLMQNLLSADKIKKQQARSIKTGMAEGSNTVASPGGQSVQLSGGSRDHRSSLGGAGVLKKGSAPFGGSSQRQLTAREQVRYGVSHHEKLSSGVSFRHQRIEKMVLAKSASQTQKVQDALIELGIPPKAVMSTSKVCDRYEKLVGGINTLLDARRIGEKTENEIRVLKAQKEAKETEGEGGGGDGEKYNSDHGGDEDEDDVRNEAKEDEEEVKNSDDEGDDENADADGDADGDGEGDRDQEEDDAEGEGSGGNDVGVEADGELQVPDSDDEAGNEDQGENSDVEAVTDADSDQEEETQDLDDSMQVDNDPEGESEAELEEEVEESRPSTGVSGRSGRKRSISVLSSAPSQRSSKRQRK